MGCFSYWGINTGFPYFFCIPILFFVGMMLMFYWFGRRWRATGCCNQDNLDLVEEVIRLRKELKELKKE